MLRYIFILLLTLASYTLNGAIYYISPTGNDISGNGSNRKPWKTLSYACTQVSNPGDVIKLKSGKFLEYQSSFLYPGVSIDGTAGGSIVVSYVLNGPTIILMSSEGTNGNQYIANLTIDGNDLEAHSGILVSGRSNVSIHHVRFKNLRTYATAFNGSSDTTDAKTRIYFGVDTTNLSPKTHAYGNRFFRNDIDNCAIFYPGDRAKGALMIGGQKDMTIFDNTIIQTSRELGNNGYPIKYYRSGHNINLKIFRNILNKSPLIDLRNEFFLGCAIELWHTTELEIYENKMQGGISLTYIKNAKIHHNSIIHNQLDIYPKTAIHASGHINNVTINNNFIKNFALQLDFIMFHKNSMNDIFIFNNVMFNIGVSSDEWWGSGIRISGLTSDTIKNVNIINNTIIANPEERNTRIGIYLPTTGYATDIFIRNNILSGFRYASIFAAGPDRIIDVISIENNILWDNIHHNKSYASSDSAYYTNIKRPLNETEKNNLFKDPLFLGIENFKLNDESPGIMSGLYIPWIMFDFEDKSISYPPNIGAYGFSLLIPDIVKYEFTVYPNPVTNYFTVIIEDPLFNPTVIKIYDFSGKLIYIKKVEDNMIYVYPLNLSSGMYIIVVENNRKEMLISKIIVY